MAAWGLEPNTTLRQHHLNPLEQLNLYLDGFHFQNGELARQIRACHYCAILSEDLIQCALFDRPDREARLIGIEYIISERLFQSLPAEEKLLWHSHGYEVASGQMTAPGLSGWAELQLADKLKTTYGKAWLTWESAEPQSLPLGIPKLMMAFTEDGQIRPELLAERDRLLNLSTARNRQERLHLNVPVAADGANAWEKGEVGQLELVRIGMSFGSRE